MIDPLCQTIKGSSATVGGIGCSGATLHTV
jgi:hypothetical protein